MGACTVDFYSCHAPTLTRRLGGAASLFVGGWRQGARHGSAMSSYRLGSRLASCFPVPLTSSVGWPKRILWSSKWIIARLFRANVVSIAYSNSALLTGVSIWNQMGNTSKFLDASAVLPATLAENSTRPER